MRTREDISNSNRKDTSQALYQFQGSAQNPVNPVFIQNYSGWHWQTSIQKTMTDVVTQGWRKLVHKGVVINNPMWQTIIQTEDPVCTRAVANAIWNSYGYVSGYRCSGTVPASVMLGNWSLGVPVLNETQLRDIAYTAAMANANTADTQLWATVGEGNKTIESLCSISKRLIKVGRALRRGKLRQLSKELTPKQLADRWMEGRYAIRPLIYDIRNTVKAASGKIWPKRQTFRGFASDSSTVSRNGNTAYNDGTCWVKVAETASRSIEARSGILAQIEQVTRTSAWGLDQPLEALWELTPFSFIVDWFFNVGDTIAALTPNAGVKTLASWVVVRSTTVETLAVHSADATATGNIYEKYHTVETAPRVRTTWSRTRIVNPLTPVVPTLNVKLNGAKLLDLVLIGRQVFSRKGL